MAVTESTCVYLIRDRRWLMLLRNRKQNDINEGKWIGIGGKREGNETSEQCALREVKEECGLDIDTLEYCGEVYFSVDGKANEYIRIYRSSYFHGNQIPCDEGTLSWIDEDDILRLNLWPGDRLFLEKMIRNEIPFSMKLDYDAQGNLL
ncbi:MAG: NUDIX hydrolase [Bulleidia sp.]